MVLRLQQGARQFPTCSKNVMAVGHVPKEQGTATWAKEMSKGEKGVESAWRFSTINLERRSFVTAALGLTLSGMAYWGLLGVIRKLLCGFSRRYLWVIRMKALRVGRAA